MTMLPESGKKIIILYILQILRKYTDSTHTMTQQQIVEKLQSEYGLEVNRTTVKRNIEDLLDAGYDRWLFFRERMEKHLATYGLGKGTPQVQSNQVLDPYEENDFAFTWNGCYDDE